MGFTFGGTETVAGAAGVVAAGAGLRGSATGRVAFRVGTGTGFAFGGTVRVGCFVAGREGSYCSVGLDGGFTEGLREVSEDPEGFDEEGFVVGLGGDDGLLVSVGFGPGARVVGTASGVGSRRGSSAGSVELVLGDGAGALGVLAGSYATATPTPRATVIPAARSALRRRPGGRACRPVTARPPGRSRSPCGGGRR